MATIMGVGVLLIFAAVMFCLFLAPSRDEN